MNAKQMKKIERFVAENIGDFHQSRLQRLKTVKLKQLLERCNPYLLKVKHMECASDFVKRLFDVHLSHSEQTMFGSFLERLVIFVGDMFCGAMKVGGDGTDMHFVRDGEHYVVSIKSGPNWGNSSATQKQKEQFRKSVRVIRQDKGVRNVHPVLGCCFGRDNNPDKGSHYRYCGQDFWKFISGDDRLYLDIIKPLGHEAKRRNDEFNKAYAQVFNIAVADFIGEYCNDGIIDWEKLVKLNSERREPKRQGKAAK